MKSSKKVASTIVCALVAIILVIILVAIIVQTKGFTTNFQTFYVTVNGDRVLGSANGYKVDNSNQLNVEVKYVLGKLISDASGYSVKVMPADNVDFDFTVDEVVHSFAEESDLSEGFVFDFQDSSFTVTSKGCVRQILSNVYSSSAVVVPEEMEKSEDEIFKLVVSSYNDNDSVEITFGVSSVVVVEGILDFGMEIPL